ncbi:GNAT family N-acetyltransferase [Modestobacter sp. VKM Ac-2977]|uniref:GNAT family N-acetyltransferase n=1 Tax=Modestobacter sp. VKM Ac-2977 TaxID=3004131 RepID=UPI003FA5732F
MRPAIELDPDWTARSRLFRRDHLAEDERRGDHPRPLAHTTAGVEHRRDLESQATYYCAQRDGELAGFVCTWSGPAGRGVIENLFVHPGSPLRQARLPATPPGAVSRPARQGRRRRGAVTARGRRSRSQADRRRTHLRRQHTRYLRASLPRRLPPQHRAPGREAN